MRSRWLNCYKCLDRNIRVVVLFACDMSPVRTCLLSRDCIQLLRVRAVNAHPNAEEIARPGTVIPKGTGLARRLSREGELHDCSCPLICDSRALHA